MTPAHEAVLELLLQGRAPRSLAGTLSVSQHTVNNYLAHLRRHYGVASTVQVVALAWRERHAAVLDDLLDCRRVLGGVNQRRRYEDREPR